MEGKILGNRYELIEKIGGGGMAVVYKARCRLLNRFVAIKILRPEFTNDEEFVKRFRVEAQAAASLSHPNIVSIYDVGHEDNIHYIVMEYVNGITLKEYIKQKGALPWKEAVDIAIQVCSAIEVAHMNNIVHRDIKPHNILITRDGIAKVTDFGIARAVTSSTITMAGSTIGSVHYFSPEQARGGYIDEKSDLYSLGITLYEMVTGELPFDGETPVSIALKHIQAEPRQPIEINNAIPISVNDIIMKSIKKEQDKRYQTARSMLDDLYRALKDPYGSFVREENLERQPTRRMQAILSEDDIQRNEVQMKPKSKKNNKNKTIWIAVAVSTAIVLIFGLITFMMVLKPAPTQSGNFVVQDYRGRDYYEVQEELQKVGIRTKENRKFSDTYAKDQIIAQSVPPGQTLKQNGYGEITFDVSKGPDLKKIPQLKGMEYREAEAKLRDELNLVPTIIDEYSDSIPVNRVTRTEPEANEEVKAGTEVIIYRSIGPELKYVKVPNLIGLDFNAAKKAIADAKLTLGKLTPTGGNNLKIISQNPMPGTEVKEETPVDLVFEEKAVQPTPTPSKQTKPLSVNLLNSSNYGDKIKVVVKITPSDTGRTETIMNEERDKNLFPFTIQIPIPPNGSTEVYVELDGSLYMKQTMR